MQGNTMAAPLPPSERLKLSRPVMASVGGDVEQVDRPSVYCRWERRGRKHGQFMCLRTVCVSRSAASDSLSLRGL